MGAAPSDAGSAGQNHPLSAVKGCGAGSSLQTEYLLENEIDA